MKFRTRHCSCSAPLAHGESECRACRKRRREKKQHMAREITRQLGDRPPITVRLNYLYHPWIIWGCQDYLLEDLS